MENKNKFFNQALSNFIHDVASGSAIRHLADSGYTVKQIAKELSYPTSEEQIGKIVWAHFVEKGVIFLEKPPAEPVLEKITYEKEYGKYGRTYFRQKKEVIENPCKKYFPCDFGRCRYQNADEFFMQLEKLWKSDREYILGLPWPLQTVWHVADERMERIFEMLELSNNQG
ncbi:MAG: hypothetical protein IJ733_02435 [Lachnospiraceae bacterium]|nr:hypothetical protein [Lachnospiraceae bacterium]